MKLKRERYISYFHKPIVQGWTTPSSSWRRWRSRWRRWRPRRQCPAGVSPSNLQLQVSVSWFLCFCGAPFRRASGTSFIVGFRSRRSFWRKDRRQRSLEAPDGGSHAAKESGHVGPTKILLGLPFVRFLGSYALFLPKTDARKILGHLDVVWVPETSKHGK